MGIYDREYYRTEQRSQGFSFPTPRSIVGMIIGINVVLWLADILPGIADPAARGWLSSHMGVQVDTLTRPWMWWQFLTAGFAHSPIDFQHILFNMLVLFFLGRDVEEAYGPKEFLRVYLVMVVFASVVWNVVNLALDPSSLGAYGASGAIAGVVVLYALNFPRRMLLLFFVIPIPAWLFGVFMVLLDMFGAAGQAGASNVAYSMHLAGAAFAGAYYYFGWNLTQLTSALPRMPKLGRRPKLRIHEPDDEPETDLREQVDQILEKIYREGEASLTAKERKTLEMASRQYQRKKKD